MSYNLPPGFTAVQSDSAPDTIIPKNLPQGFKPLDQPKDSVIPGSRPFANTEVQPSEEKPSVWSQMYNNFNLAKDQIEKSTYEGLTTAAEANPESIGGKVKIAIDALTDPDFLKRRIKENEIDIEEEAAKIYHNKSDDDPSWEPIQALTDPYAFFGTTLPKVVGGMAGLMLAPLVAGSVAGGIAAAVGSGGTAVALTAGVAGMLASRPLESVAEAQGAFDETKDILTKEGKLAPEEIEKRARQAFTSDYNDNMKLSIWDAAEVAMAVVPLGKLASPFAKGARSLMARKLEKAAIWGIEHPKTAFFAKETAIMGKEGTEEVYQQKVENAAVNAQVGEKDQKPESWADMFRDADAMAQFRGGMLGGAFMGPGLEIVKYAGKKVARIKADAEKYTDAQIKDQQAEMVTGLTANAVWNGSELDLKSKIMTMAKAGALATNDTASAEDQKAESIKNGEQKIKDISDQIEEAYSLQKHEKGIRGGANFNIAFRNLKTIQQLKKDAKVLDAVQEIDNAPAKEGESKVEKLTKIEKKINDLVKENNRIYDGADIYGERLKMVMAAVDAKAKEEAKVNVKTAEEAATATEEAPPITATGAEFGEAGTPPAGTPPAGTPPSASKPPVLTPAGSPPEPQATGAEFQEKGAGNFQEKPKTVREELISKKENAQAAIAMNNKYIQAQKDLVEALPPIDPKTVFPDAELMDNTSERGKRYQEKLDPEKYNPKTKRKERTHETIKDYTGTVTELQGHTMESLNKIKVISDSELKAATTTGKASHAIQLALRRLEYRAEMTTDTAEKKQIYDTIKEAQKLQFKIKNNKKENEIVANIDFVLKLDEKTSKEAVDSIREQKKAELERLNKDLAFTNDPANQGGWSAKGLDQRIEALEDKIANVNDVLKYLDAYHSKAKPTTKAPVAKAPKAAKAPKVAKTPKAPKAPKVPKAPKAPKTPVVKTPEPPKQKTVAELEKEKIEKVREIISEKIPVNTTQSTLEWRKQQDRKTIEVVKKYDALIKEAQEKEAPKAPEQPEFRTTFKDDQDRKDYFDPKKNGIEIAAARAKHAADITLAALNFELKAVSKLTAAEQMLEKLDKLQADQNAKDKKDGSGGLGFLGYVKSSALRNALYDILRQFLKAQIKFGEFIKQAFAIIDKETGLTVQERKLLKFQLRQEISRIDNEIAKVENAQAQLDATKANEASTKKDKKVAKKNVVNSLEDLSEAIEDAEADRDENVKKMDRLGDKQAAGAKKVLQLYTSTKDGKLVEFKDATGRVIGARKVRQRLWNFAQTITDESDLISQYASIGDGIGDHLLNNWRNSDITSLHNVLKSTIQINYAFAFNKDGVYDLFLSNGIKANDFFKETFENQVREHLRTHDIENKYHLIADKFMQHADATKRAIERLEQTKPDNKLSREERAQKKAEIDEQIKTLAVKYFNQLATGMEQLTGISADTWLTYLRSNKRYESITYATAEDLFIAKKTTNITKFLLPDSREYIYEKLLKSLFESPGEYQDKNRIPAQIEMLANVVAADTKEINPNFRSVIGKQKSSEEYKSHYTIDISLLPTDEIQNSNRAYLDKKKEVPNPWTALFKKVAPKFLRMDGVKNNTNSKSVDAANASIKDIKHFDILAFLNKGMKMVGNDRYFQHFEQQSDKSSREYIEAKKYTTSEAKAMFEKIKDKFPKDFVDQYIKTELVADILEMLDNKSLDPTLISPSVYKVKGQAINPTDKLTLAKQLAEAFGYNFAVNKYYIDQYFYPETDINGKKNYSKGYLADKMKRQLVGSGLQLNYAVMRAFYYLRQGFSNSEENKYNLLNNVVINDPMLAMKLFDMEEKDYELFDGLILMHENTAKAISEASGSIMDYGQQIKSQYSKNNADNSRTYLKGNTIVLTKEMADRFSRKDKNGNEINAITKLFYHMGDPRYNIDTIAFTSAAKKSSKENVNEITWDIGKDGEINFAGNLPEFKQEPLDIRYYLVQQDLRQESRIVRKNDVRQQWYHGMRFKNAEQQQGLLNKAMEVYKGYLEKNILGKTDQEKKDWFLEKIPKTKSNQGFIRLLKSGISIDNPIIQTRLNYIFANIIEDEVLGVKVPGAVATSIPNIFGPLKAMYLDKKTNKVVQPEAMLPAGYRKSGLRSRKDKIEQYAKDHPNEKNFNAAIADIKGDYAFITRVPSTELHSTSLVEIVDWIPESMGSVVATATGVSQVAGEDFDGDMRYIKVQYRDKVTSEVIKDGSPKGIMNKVFDLQMENYFNGDNYNDLVNPIDTSKAKTIVKEYKAADANLNYYAPNSLYTGIQSSQEGTRVIGILARANAVYNFLKRSGAELKSIIKVPEITDKGATGNTLELKGLNFSKKQEALIRSIAANNLNHATDNVKEQNLEYLGLTEATAMLSTFLQYFGVDEYAAVKFMHNPVVQEYIKMVRESKSPNSDTERNEIYYALAEKYYPGSTMKDGPFDKKMAFENKNVSLTTQEWIGKGLTDEQRIKVLKFLNYTNNNAQDFSKLSKLIKGIEDAPKSYAQLYSFRALVTKLLNATGELDDKSSRLDFGTLKSISFTTPITLNLSTNEQYYKGQLLDSPMSRGIITKLKSYVMSKSDREMNKDYTDEQISTICNAISNYALNEALDITENNVDLTLLATKWFNGLPENSVLREILTYDIKKQQIALKKDVRTTRLDDEEIEVYRKAFDESFEGNPEAKADLIKYHVRIFGYGDETGSYGGFSKFFSTDMDKDIGEKMSALKAVWANYDKNRIEHVAEQVFRNNPLLIPEVTTAGSENELEIVDPNGLEVKDPPLIIKSKVKGHGIVVMDRYVKHREATTITKGSGQYAKQIHIPAKDTFLYNALTGQRANSFDPTAKLNYDVYKKEIDNTPEVKENNLSYKEASEQANAHAPIEQNFFDGYRPNSDKSKLHAFRPELKAKGYKTTMDLIKAGIRTRTTRTESWMKSNPLKVGDYRWMSDKKGNKVLTQITAIYPNTKDTWNKEGWRDSDFEYVKDYATAIEFKVVENSKSEISSNSKGLEGALTNPTELAKSKGNIKQSYPVTFRGKTYVDAEAAYQALKGTATKDEGANSTYNLMVDIIKTKLEQHPSLAKAITEKGGSEWILKATHQPTNKNSVWETGGKDWFIKALNEAYLNSNSKEQTEVKTSAAEILPVQTSNLTPFQQKYNKFLSDLKIVSDKYYSYRVDDNGKKYFVEIEAVNKPKVIDALGVKWLLYKDDRGWRIDDAITGKPIGIYNKKTGKEAVAQLGNFNGKIESAFGKAMNKAIAEKEISPRYQYIKDSNANPGLKYQRKASTNEKLSSADPKLQEAIRKKLSKAFPGIKVFTDAKAFQDYLNKHFYGERLDITALGAAIGKAIFINPDSAVQSTEIHEFAHHYWDALPANHPAKIALIRFWRTEEKAIQAIGEAGVDIMNNAIHGNRSERFKQMLKDFWAAVKNFFGRATPEEITRIFASNVLNNTREIKPMVPYLKYQKNPQNLTKEQNKIIDQLQKAAQLLTGVQAKKTREDYGLRGITAAIGAMGEYVYTGEQDRPAADRGTALHDIVDQVIQGVDKDKLNTKGKCTPEVAGKIYDYVTKYVADEVAKGNAVLSETPLGSTQFHLNGKVDMTIISKDGRISLRDWKFSTKSKVGKAYDAKQKMIHGLQQAMYGIMYQTGSPEVFEYEGSKIGDMGVIPGKYTMDKNDMIIDIEFEPEVPMEFHTYNAEAYRITLANMANMVSAGEQEFKENPESMLLEEYARTSEHKIDINKLKNERTALLKQKRITGFKPRSPEQMRLDTINYKINEVQDAYVKYKSDFVALHKLLKDTDLSTLTLDELTKYLDIIGDYDLELRNISIYKGIAQALKDTYVMKQNEITGTNINSVMDLKDRDAAFLAPSDMRGAIPEWQAVMRQYLEATQEASMMYNEAEKELLPLAEAVIKEKRKQNSILDKAKEFVSITGGSNEEYFENEYDPKTGDYKLPNDPSLSVAERAHLAGVRKWKEKFKDIQNESFDKWSAAGSDINSAISVSKTFWEEFHAGNFFTAFAQWLGNDKEINSIRLAYKDPKTGASKMMKYRDVVDTLNADYKKAGKLGLVERTKLNYQLVNYHNRAAKAVKAKYHENITGQISTRDEDAISERDLKYHYETKDGRTMKVINDNPGTHVLNAKGHLISSHQFKRSEKLEVTHDTHRAIMSYIKNMAYLQKVNPLMPQIIALQAVEQQIQNRPHLIKFIDDWMNTEILGKKEVSKWGSNIDNVIRFLTNWTYFTTMTFNVGLGAFNLTTGIYNTVVNKGFGRQLIGAGRLGNYKTNKKANAILDHYRVITIHKDPDPRLSATKIFLWLSDISIVQSEKVIQGCAFLGGLPKEVWDNFDENGKIIDPAKELPTAKVVEMLLENDDIQGKYREHNKRNYRANAYFAAAMQFKTWFPDFLNSRLMDADKSIYGKDKKGITRSVVWQLNGKRLKHMISNHPDFWKSQDIDAKNARANLRGLLLLGLLFTSWAAVHGDDDDRALANKIWKMLSQMAMIYNLSDFARMVTFPSVNTINNLVDAILSIVTLKSFKKDSIYGEKGDLVFPSKIAKLAPYGNSAKWLLTNDNYNVDE